MHIEPITTWCPACGELHLDKKEWEFKPHNTHLCERCNHTWKPFETPTRGVMWTLAEVQGIIKKLEYTSVTDGWHFALAGGVIRNGSSKHDLDLIAYPRTSVKSDRESLRFSLSCWGWHLRMPVKELHKHWKSNGGKDRKHVEVWQTKDGRRVDLIILGDNPGWFGVR